MRGDNSRPLTSSSRESTQDSGSVSCCEIFNSPASITTSWEVSESDRRLRDLLGGPPDFGCGRAGCREAGATGNEAASATKDSVAADAVRPRAMLSPFHGHVAARQRIAPAWSVTPRRTLLPLVSRSAVADLHRGDRLGARRPRLSRDRATRVLRSRWRTSWRCPCRRRGRRVLRSARPG